MTDRSSTGDPAPGPGLIFSLYAAWPDDDARTAEAAAQQLLAAIPAVTGLELPWSGAGVFAAWPAGDAGPSWRHVVTGMPRALDAAVRSPLDGLASTDPEGRRAAVQDALALRDAVLAYDDASGRNAIRAVQLPSAPRRYRPEYASQDALRRSLDELAALDWDDADLLVEHADAYVSEETSEKGFLTLDEEIAAVHAVGSPAVRMSLNWGRSVVELRSADRVLEHVRAARSAGVLRAFTVSGVCGPGPAADRAWADEHVPWRAGEGTSVSAPDSLLTVDRARSALETAGDLDWIGVKFAVGQTGASAADYADLARETIAILRPVPAWS